MAQRDLQAPELMDLSFITLADGAVPAAATLEGLLIGNIILHCDAIGDVRLTLVSDDFTIVYDTQDIQQVPEPGTILLLGRAASAPSPDVAEKLESDESNGQKILGNRFPKVAGQLYNKV